jgi:hypothetical protein
VPLEPDWITPTLLYGMALFIIVIEQNALAVELVLHIEYKLLGIPHDGPFQLNGLYVGFVNVCEL